MDDFLSFIVIFIVIFLLICGFCFAIILGVNELERYSCKVVSSKLGLEHSYSIWTGCLVRTSDRRFIPLEGYHSYIKG